MVSIYYVLFIPHDSFCFETLSDFLFLVFSFVVQLGVLRGALYGGAVAEIRREVRGT